MIGCYVGDPTPLRSLSVPGRESWRHPNSSVGAESPIETQTAATMSWRLLYLYICGYWKHRISPVAVYDLGNKHAVRAWFYIIDRCQCFSSRVLTVGRSVCSGSMSSTQEKSACLSRYLSLTSWYLHPPSLGNFVPLPNSLDCSLDFTRVCFFGSIVREYDPGGDETVSLKVNSK